MAYTTIDDPSAYFQTMIFTGDGNDNRALTNDGNSDLQPDWIWFKNRITTNGHNLLDSTRGVGKTFEGTSNTNAEGDTSTRLTSFDSDGFTVKTDPSVNGDTNGIVAWQWKANGGTTTTNDASSTGVGNQDSVFQANTTAGFSIVTWTGSNANATLAHGLGAVPNWIIVKARAGTEKWGVYHHKNTAAPETDQLILNATDATADSTTLMNDTAPTSSVFTVADSGIANEDGKTYIGYLFAEKQGYSKFGSYIGNGNADGPFIYLGFKPAWFIVKRTDSTGNWLIYDAKRDVNNLALSYLLANGSNAESTASTGLDFLSNGLKIRRTGGTWNTAASPYVYMAFAESPFVTSTGIPATAR
jgi:hypothetical protein